jgi:hypothetical protein
VKWMSALVVSLSLSQVALSAPLHFDEGWNPSISGPDIMNMNFEKNFTTLPLSGKVSGSEKYWSGDYWPLRNGNINYRWYSQNKIGFNLISPGLERAKKMTIPQLAELSPSEKYDLLTGRYDYPLKNKVSEIANPSAEIWEGICHGWSPASMNHNEPTPKLLFNPDGIEVPFGSTDIKALLSYYYAHVHRAADTHQMGSRCYEENSRQTNCNNDLNAGAFHIVLANRIGFEKKGVIADMQRFKEVWNNPITSYQSRVLGSNRPRSTSASGTTQVFYLQTTVTYAAKGIHDWHPVNGTAKQTQRSQVFEYEIELSGDGTIIGGEWKSKSRPDFLWIMPRAQAFNGILSRLGELTNDE